MKFKRNHIIKVCKIDSLSFASFAIKQNVDFLGIHILSTENIGEYSELNNFIKRSDAKSIIVTKIHEIEILKKLIEFYMPSGIQFHFEIDPLIVNAIRKLFPKLILFGVITNHSKYLDYESINDLHDYLIYDTSYLGGTNKKNSYPLLQYFPEKLKEKTLLAGGITLERINELHSLNICGYDIQSYFRFNSELNYRNLDKVCDLLKYPRKKKLSISLTDIPLEKIYQASSYYLNSNLDYHLDFSDGSLYASFNTIDKSITEKQNFITQIPYSIHLFIKNEKEIEDKINNLSNKHPLNLIRIFVQYYDGINLNKIFNTTNDIKVIPSVYYKDLLSFISKSFDSQFLSIVIPNPENEANMLDFLNIFTSNRRYFENKEIWLDRNIEKEYIIWIIEHLGNNFNFIIGKHVINDLSIINNIHDDLFKQE
ncbi:MAG: hypothetical protein K0M40_14185 [Prolixibacteraceae bacterium]|nr:hypothetical protein [Prolixibacteraceae bacterium]